MQLDEISGFGTDATGQLDRTAPPRVLWFFGPSAAGKRTLLRRVESGDEELVAALEIAGPTEPCLASLAGSEADRSTLGAAIAELARPGVTVLVKGQTHDLDWRNLPEQVGQSVPGCRQDVLFVWADPTVLAQRCAARRARYASMGDEAKAESWAAYDEPTCRWETGENLGLVRELRLPIVYVENDGPHVALGAPPPPSP